MPGANLSTLPVELFARILEDIEILDILRLKLVRTFLIVKTLSS